jgi:uncharacterized repeat protein (TIGR03806 family)
VQPPDVTAPTVPADLVAVSRSSSRVDLSWSASTDAGTGVGGYQVYRDGVQVGTVAAPAVTFQDQGLTAATTYSFTVRALDRASPPNVSAPSAAAAATTLLQEDVDPPTVPLDVTAVAILPNRVLVSWSASADAGTGVGGYQVFRGGALVATVNAPATSYLDAAVSAATSYAYQVAAFDLASPANVSAASSTADVTTPPPDTVAPSIPQDVVATALAFDKVRVTWSPSTDVGTGVAGYEVRRGGATIGTVTAPDVIFEETGLSALTAYSYTVRAFDRNLPPNFSLDSLPASATTHARPPGLDRRPSNTTCLAPAAPTQAALVYRSDPWPGLPGFQQPTRALQAPGDPSRWFVVEQYGKVKVFANDPGVASASIFIDLSADATRNFSHFGPEMGLLGMAFHPSWPTVPEAFLLYTTQTTAPATRQTHISRFRSTDGGLTLDPGTEQVVFAVDQPDLGHKAGDLHFGSDGYLYASIGDGGGSFGQYGTTQDLTTTLAKMLRLEVRGTGAGYLVPGDNPYAGNPQCPPAGGTLPCPEMFAFGFRNPWRWSFDRVTGDMWVADVGQDRWEEVDRVEKGLNYGWNVREGAHCVDGTDTCAQPGTLLSGALLVDPEVEYPHLVNGLPTGDSSVTGGYVYRGTAIPALVGQYVFADFISGNVWTHSPGVAGDRTLLFNIGFPVSSFAEDVTTGELYATDYGSGKLWGIAPQTGGAVDTVPMDLAEACPSAIDPDGPDSVLIPYALNAPFWSDGAVKQRWMALPDGAVVTIEPGSLDFTFPIGTVLVKQFKLGGKRVETRLLMRHTDGSWAGYSYEWNDAETAATRVVGGKTKDVGTQTWLYPSGQQCLQCHTAAAGMSLGPETAQQNGDFTYPQTGRTSNQLAALDAIGVLTLPGDPSTLPALPAPFGSAPLEQRARAYLHSNCSNCHRPGGPTPAAMDLRYSTPLALANICDALPGAGDLGIAGARLVAPGSPSTSVLLERVKRTDRHRMPPLGRFLEDPQGVQLLTDWITSLQGCP